MSESLPIVSFSLFRTEHGDTVQADTFMAGLSEDIQVKLKSLMLAYAERIPELTKP
jgi:hypothetical protein